MVGWRTKFLLHSAKTEIQSSHTLIDTSNSRPNCTLLIFFSKLRRQIYCFFLCFEGFALILLVLVFANSASDVYASDTKSSIKSSKFMDSPLFINVRINS